LPAGVSKRTASMSFSSSASSALAFSSLNRATLKLVGRVTISTLIASSGGRIACGSGLHRSPLGIEIVHTLASV